MSRKPLLFFAALAASFLLSSCTAFNPVTDDLMKPPRLTSEQKAIEDALRESVISSHITFKYPKNGDYRSAFIFHDIDGDTSEEALVFYYAPDLSDYARIALLDQQANGQWRSIGDLPGPDRDVEFVAFADITTSTPDDIVIGWSNPDQGTREIGVYAYTEGSLENILKKKGTYDSYLIDDLDNDGLKDIVLLNRESNSSDSAWISLITYDGYGLSNTSSLPLSDRIQQFAGVVSGKLSADDDRKVVFVDELLSSGELVTEIFTMADGSLDPVVSYDMDSWINQEKYLDSQGRSTYRSTRRVNVAANKEDPPTPICTDINQDGVIEIPTLSLLPGYEDYDEAEQLYLTEYNQLRGRTLVRVLAAAVNRSGGYLVKFPDTWIDKVTIASQTEKGEWSFIEYNGETLDDVSKELARIRVVSKNDYQDKFMENYQEFDPPRGIFTYYGYVPKDPVSPLSISLSELEGLFSLL